jgi:hypothetical protein
MSAILHRGTWVAAALVAAVVVAALIPLCAMPDCTRASSVSCGSSGHGCSGCGQTVVMKHEGGGALTARSVQVDVPVAVGAVAVPNPYAIVEVAPLAPVPTASPPPQDPLGVRLIV